MATSSITKNFVVSDKKQVEQFADAIEMSYKESLSESSPSSCRYREIHETDEVYRVMETESNRDHVRRRYLRCSA